MSDIFGRVTEEQDFFKKILSKIPGFGGYIEQGNRRNADKLLRENLANHFEAIWQRISGLQRDVINQGGIEYIDDMEAAAIKLRQFIDRVRTAAYGYAGFFDAIKVRKEELDMIYQYDMALIQLEDQVSGAVDNMEASIGTDGLAAAIRNLITLSQQCVDAFNKRSEVILGGAEPTTAGPTN